MPQGCHGTTVLPGFWTECSSGSAVNAAGVVWLSYFLKSIVATIHPNSRFVDNALHPWTMANWADRPNKIWSIFGRTISPHLGSFKFFISNKKSYLNSNCIFNSMVFAISDLSACRSKNDWKRRHTVIEGKFLYIYYILSLNFSYSTKSTLHLELSRLSKRNMTIGYAWLFCLKID